MEEVINGILIVGVSIGVIFIVIPVLIGIGLAMFRRGRDWFN